MLNFDQPKHDLSSIIKVIGVGGGGSNAVNHMFRQGITGVDFVVCNTDKQALDVSPVPNKIQLGATLTEGLGAGSLPEIGKNAAIESLEDIKSLFGTNTKMVFITAGMGGGTGTGAAPIIAKTARELGILTVGIITIPFVFEGKKRKQQAEAGLEELKDNVDTLLVIANDKLREIHGNLKVAEAFSKADDVLSNAAKSIAEIISMTFHVNVDFNDIKTVMQNSGVAIMGSGYASGENRAVRAVEAALASPLLNDSDISGARYVLLNVSSGKEELSMDEFGDIVDYIQEAAGQTAEIIQGYGIDANLNEDVKVTIIATGFNGKDKAANASRTAEVKKISLLDEAPAATTSLAESTPIAIEVTHTLIEIEKPLYEEPFLKSVENRIELEVNEPKTVEPEITASTSDNLYEEPYLKVNEETPLEVINEVELEEEVINKEQINDEPYLKINTIEASIEETHIVDSAPVIEYIDLAIENEHTPEEETIETMQMIEESFLNTEVEELNFVSDETISTVQEEIPQPVMETTSEVNFIIHEIKEEPIAQSIKSDEPFLKTPDGSTTSANDYYARTQERIAKLKQISFKIKTQNGLADMETEPAYVRRGINLTNTPHSSQSSISKFSLQENEENKTEIKNNENNFLHNRPD